MMHIHQKSVPDIRHTAIFNAPIHKVWQAVATSEGLAHWFMPNNFEPKEGHEFFLESPFGPSPCRVLEINPPHRLVFAWDTFGWKVTFELKEVGEGTTEFTLIHSGWGKPDDVIPKAGAPHAEIRDRMNQGWDGLVHERLRKRVED